MLTTSRKASKTHSLKPTDEHDTAIAAPERGPEVPHIAGTVQDENGVNAP
jgi:hypothetical protein